MLNQAVSRFCVASTALLSLAAGGAFTTLAQQNVLQPGDPIIASSANMPGSEGVANAIDGKPTKYLNFDTRTGGKPSGFVVTPSVGVTRVVGIAMQSANDAPERDPKIMTIEGSNDDTVTDFASGNWELIVKIDNVPAFADRFAKQTLFFDNLKPYKHYRWIVLETQTVNDCCMQIAEVELLGTLLPQSVVQPGDAIIASSSNMPGSEGVANVIDGKPTKYLNFDTRTGGKPSGFIVTPSIGATVVTGLKMESANDAPERDPKIITLEGSNDDTITDWASGTWELIVKMDSIPAFADRFTYQTFLFDNYKPYKHYRWTVLETQTINDCCMQIAEVELLGSGAPKSVLQPGDTIFASSSNMPGSEGVANAIDGKPTKYLNFDTRTGGKASGFAVTPSIGATTITGMSLQSANDAPERDPKIVTIEGSNDDTLVDYATGNWELIVKFDNIPAFADRFVTQTFYFANKKSYKHYRWIVLETQTLNDCCMQIAEVGLLAVTSQTDCSKAKFLVQPTDTPVLENAQATFSTTVNGPWPLQWYKNGEMIPGATATTYTTADPVTTANQTNVYTVKIVGCEESTPVKAVVFTPSATKSIGISFRGGGANGSPTDMLETDIAGLQPQAYWNNATNSAGATGDTVALPDVLKDSSNNDSTITVEFAASGTWGSGTGAGNPTQRMLNGMVVTDSSTTGPERTITFHSVPAGKHAVIVYMVGIPLQFQNAWYKVTGKTEQTYYVRVVNADEYNAAPGFYRGIGTTPATRSLATYVRFDNVEADANGDVVMTWQNETPGFDRGVPVNGIQLVLNAPAPGAPPSITADPQAAFGAEGGTVTMSVAATGNGLTYQWRKSGRNLPNGGNISGATTDTLRITSLSAADEAVYSVAVFNADGSVVSKNATVTISKFDINDAMVGHWKFDETSGKTAANSAGGQAATLVDPVAWGAAKIANGLTFDGYTTYGTVASYTVAKRQISASGWVNVDPTTSAGVAFFRNAEGQIGIGTGQSPNTPAGQFEIGLSYNADAGTAALTAAVGAGPNIVRATAPSAFGMGAWHHVAFSADGARLNLYLDGALVGSADYLATINAPDIAYLTFGARLNKDTTQDPPVIVVDPTTPELLMGKLDDFALWTRALTADEVSKIYAAGQAGKDVSTVKVVVPITPTISMGSDAKITFVGTLQAADTVNGTFSDVAGATSPYTVPAGTTMKFFRTVVK